MEFIFYNVEKMGLIKLIKLLKFEMRRKKVESLGVLLKINVKGDKFKGRPKSKCLNVF